VTTIHRMNIDLVGKLTARADFLLQYGQTDTHTKSQTPLITLATYSLPVLVRRPCLVLPDFHHAKSWMAY